MSEFINFLKAQWHDIKGNAKWDFIKWGFGAILVTPAIIAALVKFIGHAPLWEVLLVLAVGYITAFSFLLGLIFLILKRGGVKSDADKPKRKTKEERNKAVVDKIIKRNFPEWLEIKPIKITIPPS
jgi:hypothetical protein